MTARRAHFGALLILMLIFSAVQCMASCAADDCSSALPPCHQHQNPSHATSTACTQDFLVPDAHGSSLAHAATLVFVAPEIYNANWFVVSRTSMAPAFSPPKLSLPASSILRI
jgi:hypothetical protein